MFEQSSSEIPSSIWASMNSWFTPAVFFVLLNVMIGTIAFTSTFANKKQKQNQNQQQNETHHPKIVGSSPSVLQRLKSTSFYPYYNRSQDPQNLSIYKQTPDSDTHINHEHTQNLETQSHYFFQENSVQDPQNLSIDKQTPDSDTLLNPEHSQNLETQSHYFFQESLQISQTQASNSIFEQNSQETQTHFVFDQKDSNLDDLDDFKQAHEEKVEENEPAQSMDEVHSHLTGSHFIRTKSDTVPSSGEIPVKLPEKMRKSASLNSAFGHFEEEKIVEARRPATVRENKVTEDDEEVDAKADDFINKFKQQLKLQRLDSILRYKDVIGRGGGPSGGR